MTHHPSQCRFKEAKSHYCKKRGNIAVKISHDRKKKINHEQHVDGVTMLMIIQCFKSLPLLFARSLLKSMMLVWK